MAYCSFCNNVIQKASGLLYVKRDGTTLTFCGGKCKRNMLNLGREGRLVKWTNKGLALVSEKREDKKESALAKEIGKKLADKSAKK